MNRLRALPALAGLLMLASLAPAADWPSYRHDLARSGASEEQLAFPLHLSWSYVSAQPPRPAWPEPGRELHRLAFDYAFDVVDAEGLVFFGSSADHTVRALDAATGEERWLFPTSAPVRFAPAYDNGRLYIASDDGCLYCLQAASGELLWTFRGGPQNELVMGNEQLVSRWPLRTGVGVDRGIVYVSAGMWPNEGVYLTALRASDGEVLWQSDAGGIRYQAQPHPGSNSLIGVSAQGYLLGQPGQLALPTGRNMPALFERANGQLQYYRSAPDGWNNRWGGTWNMFHDGLLIGWRNYHVVDAHVTTGEGKPDPKKDGLAAFDAKTGKRQLELAGKLRAVVKDGRLYASGAGAVTAYDFGKWIKGTPANKCQLWSTPRGRTYALIVGGSTVYAAGTEGVVALDGANGKVLWQATAPAQIRSLAVANGHLLASCTDGRILCFAPGEGAARTVQPTIQPLPKTAGDVREKTIALLNAGTSRDGLCLVVGATDASQLAELAAQSKLILHAPVADAAQALVMRKALVRAGLLGTRIVIHDGTLATTHFPDYFAERILVFDKAAANPADLYRVLHPAGGELVVAGNESQWLRTGGMPAGEIALKDGLTIATRGRLPGADDWTHQYANETRSGASRDERVKLPLQLLWFGRPGPATLVSRHWAGPAPLASNGAMFVLGEKDITVVDAYNGRQLWHKNMEQVARWPMDRKGSGIVLDEDSLYLARGGQCRRFSARTGELVATYELPDLPAGFPQIPRVWGYVAVRDGLILGGMGSDENSQCLFAMDKATGKPRWIENPNGTIPNQTIAWEGNRLYSIVRLDTRDPAVLRRRGLPVSGNILQARDTADGQVLYTTKDGITNQSWLVAAGDVVFSVGSSQMTGHTAKTGRLLYQQPVRRGRSFVVVNDTIYAEPLAYDLHTGKQRSRTNAFGESEGWSFTRSYGCGTIAGAPNVLTFRSGALGVYDLAGDTGIFNFSGIRAGCYINAVASQGLLLVTPGDAGCSCSYSFQTTLALAPAPKHRTWTVFYDRLPNTPVERIAYNLGAPGDFGDDDGRRWLALPRPPTRRHRKNIAVPYELSMAPGQGSYQSDLQTFPYNELPMVYANGISGLRRAVIDLAVRDRALSAWPTQTPPSVDGQSTDPCWDGYKDLPAGPNGMRAMLRYDDQALYALFARDAQGKPWRLTVDQPDGPVWQDDSAEIYLSDGARTCLHLGVSASGARYDALWRYETPEYPVLDLPQGTITIDGDPADWQDQGLVVHTLPSPKARVRTAKDFDVTMRLAWNTDGLLVCAEVVDNKLQESGNANQLWTGDSLELFVTPGLRRPNFYQLLLSPGADGKQKELRHQFYTFGPELKAAALSQQSAARRTKNGYVVEALLPWANLGLVPTPGLAFGFQVLANDQDGREGNNPFRAMWHAAGHPKDDPAAFQLFRLTDKTDSQTLTFTRAKGRPDRWKQVGLAKPRPFPAILPTLGRDPENAAYNPVWQAKTEITKDRFLAEMAIPWASLEKAGIRRDQVVANIAARGAMRQAPAIGRWGCERLTRVPPRDVVPKRWTVRLHFAEREQAKPGQRVFDVRLQGQTVLAKFDLGKESESGKHPVVREFSGIVAGRAVDLELVPSEPGVVPVLNGIEILAEE
jgi:outer membrane protein assembly factor BamB